MTALAELGGVGIGIGVAIIASKIQEGGTPVNGEAAVGRDNDAIKEHWAEQRENQQQWTEHDNAPNEIRDGTDYRRVDETTTKVKGTSKDDPAPSAKVGNLPKPPTGKGSVAKEDRDKKRSWTPKEKVTQRKDQGNKCAGCGKKINKDNGVGHHIKRHADGGKTNKENHAQVCRTECHPALHAGTKKQ
jgi:hypothetical protein